MFSFVKYANVWRFCGVCRFQITSLRSEPAEYVLAIAVKLIPTDPERTAFNGVGVMFQTLFRLSNEPESLLAQGFYVFELFNPIFVAMFRNIYVETAEINSKYGN